jgi:fatty acid-binding protein DegV
VTIAHALNPAAAERAAGLARETYPVERLIITELSATFGSQLGPGAAGIGIAPAAV